MIVNALRNAANRHSSRPALAYDGFRWSWRDVWEQVRRLAAGLRDRGVEPGDYVALWLPNSPAFVLAYFAALARGAIVVPIHPGTRPGDNPLRDIPLKMVITSRELEQVCRETLSPGDAVDPPSFVVAPENAWDWDLAAAAPIDPEEQAASQPALLQHSSGATGRPKLLYRTHGQCVAEMRHFQAACGVTERDVIFCAIPLFHAHGMANALWAAVSSGATLILMKHPQPFVLQWSRALDMLERERVTVFPGVPLMFDILANAQATADLSHLRLCFSAGAAMPRHVCVQFLEKFGVPVRQLYGCTEAGSVTIDRDPDPLAGLGTAGRPMPGVEVEIRDADGRPLAAGETGEVVFRSPALTDGYVGADPAADRCFRDGWFLTGDTGRLDTAGRLEIVGRKHFVISVAGQKVYAEEVESVLMTDPAIAEAAVIGVPDERTGQAIKAFVVLREQRSDAEIAEYCRTQLPPFKRPGQIVRVSALPRTPLGKLDRAQLE